MKLIPATAEHIKPIVEAMAQRDVTELRELFNQEPEETIRRGLAGSTSAWTMVGKDGPVVMFGVAPQCLFDSAGFFWIVATTRICSQRLAFAKATKRFLPVVFRDYVRLENILDHRHTDVVRWAEWLGAKLTKISENSSKMVLERSA